MIHQSLSNRKSQIFDRCVCEAEKSPMQFKHGCIATIGGKEIGKGYNTFKNYSKHDNFLENTCSMHAEINVLRQIYHKAKRRNKLRKMKRVILYISRVNGLGTGCGKYNSAPCSRCIEVIKQMNIKKIVYFLDNEFHIEKPVEYSHCHITSGSKYLSSV